MLIVKTTIEVFLIGNANPDGIGAATKKVDFN